MSHALLVNLAPAVSTEMVRWCCEHWELELRESLHVPVFHIIPLAFYGTSNAQRPAVVYKGKILRTEPQIIKYLDALAPPDKRLVPEGKEGREVLKRVKYYRETTRRAGVVQYMYYHLLKRRELVWTSFTTDTPSFEHPLARWLFPLIKLGLTEGLHLSPARAKRGLINIREGFTAVEKQLADGRPYLMGDDFTLADLSFAACTAPALLLDGYGGHLPTVERLPEAMRDVVYELRSRPAGQFAARIYRDHRYPARS